MDFILLIISISSPLIPLLLGIKNRRTLLWKYVMAGFISDFSILLFRKVFFLPHYIIGNLFIAVEFIFISLICNQYFLNKKIRTYLMVGQVILLLYYVITSYSTFLTKFNSNIGAIFHVAYLVYALLGFYRIVSSKIILYLDRSMYFWINCGLILYASGSTFLFLFSSYLSAQNSSLHHALWSRFFIGVNIVTNLIWAKALRQQVDLQDE